MDKLSPIKILLYVVFFFFKQTSKPVLVIRSEFDWDTWRIGGNSCYNMVIWWLNKMESYSSENRHQYESWEPTSCNGQEENTQIQKYIDMHTYWSRLQVADRDNKQHNWEQVNIICHFLLQILDNNEQRARVEASMFQRSGISLKPQQFVRWSSVWQS